MGSSRSAGGAPVGSPAQKRRAAPGVCARTGAGARPCESCSRLLLPPASVSPPHSPLPRPLPCRPLRRPPAALAGVRVERGGGPGARRSQIPVCLPALAAARGVLRERPGLLRKHATCSFAAGHTSAVWEASKASASRPHTFARLLSAHHHREAPPAPCRTRTRTAATPCATQSSSPSSTRRSSAGAGMCAAQTPSGWFSTFVIGVAWHWSGSLQGRSKLGGRPARRVDLSARCNASLHAAAPHRCAPAGPPWPRAGLPRASTRHATPTPRCWPSPAHSECLAASNNGHHAKGGGGRMRVRCSPVPLRWPRVERLHGA